MMEDELTCNNIECNGNLTKTLPAHIDGLLLSTTSDTTDMILLASPSSDHGNENENKKRQNDGDEKCDVDPENSKKSCDVTPDTDDISLIDNPLDVSDDQSGQSDKNNCDKIIIASGGGGGGVGVNGILATGGDGIKSKVDIITVTSSNEKNTVANKSLEIDTDKVNESSKAALAFTIDFNEGKQVDSKKYNDIVERFQKRHRRGVSMSKLDDKPITSNISPNVIPKSQKPPVKKAPINKHTEGEQEVKEKVTLRDKNRLTQKDLGSDRHSWSPRTSMQQTCDDEQQNASSTIPFNTESKVFKPKSAVLQMALQNKTTTNYEPQSAVPTSSASPDMCSDKDDVVCIVPPLEFRKLSTDDNASVSSVSEAGTYTLDGDNYTEEQKALMSIDKLSKLSKEATLASLTAATTSTTSHDMDSSLFNATQIEVIDLESLESNFEKPKLKKHTSYLERFKSKMKTSVKTISDRTFHKNRSSPETEPQSINSGAPQPPKTLDLGNFTSVTSSGVFSKKSQQLAPKEMVRRKSSLTKSQIDSSEYIQKVDEKLLNSFTDYEKAQHNDYQLNIFSAQGKARGGGETSDKCLISIQSPRISTSCSEENTRDSSYGIDRAETKNDWIQEWAKNARKNTKKPSSARSSSERATNRHSIEYGQNIQHEEFGDNCDRNYSNRKTVNRYDDTGNMTSIDDHLLRQYEQRRHSNRRNMGTIEMVSSSDFGDDMDDEESLASSRFETHTSTAGIFATTQALRREFFNSTTIGRPPISPTKIPSPMHSMTRPRSSSVNRSLHNSVTDLDKHDTEMYLHKTAAAISTLQNIHRNNNSPQMPSSPVRKLKASSNFTPSPSIRRHHHNSSTVNNNNDYTTKTMYNNHNNNNNYSEHIYSSSTSLHKRNLSLDGTEIKPKIKENMFHSYNSDGLNVLLNSKYHSRHNSYEDKPSPSGGGGGIDQTFAPHIMHRSNMSPPSIKQNASPSQRSGEYRTKNASTPAQPTQIKRSSSFSTKPFMRPSSGGAAAMNHTTATKALTPKLSVKTRPTLQKSASSASFKNMAGKYENDIYLNDADDLYASAYSSESEFSEGDTAGADDSIDKEIITNTRYNKAFLIRLEQNKPKAATPAPKHQGMAACPNTPELPRRDIRARQSLRERTSMPRDSSINRMKQDIPNFNATKKGLSSPIPNTSSGNISAIGKEKDAATRSNKVLPKYLDISKYKPSQGNTFLKRDESKSTLINKEIKRSSSAFLNKSDVGRSSVRSVKSATSNKSVELKSTALSAAKDAAAREAELAMWRRRANYDPMKAAAEGKRKQEAKKLAQASKYNESSSVVLRSQSFHSGVGQSNTFSSSDSMDAIKTRWTLISTESSDDEFLE